MNVGFTNFLLFMLGWELLAAVSSSTFMKLRRQEGRKKGRKERRTEGREINKKYSVDIQDLGFTLCSSDRTL
jgi:hypothetical protein